MPPKKERDLSGSVPAIRAIAAGTELAGSIIAGGLIGYFLGRALGEGASIAGLVIGLLVGLVGGLYRIYQQFK